MKHVESRAARARTRRRLRSACLIALLALPLPVWAAEMPYAGPEQAPPEAQAAASAEQKLGEALRNIGQPMIQELPARSSRTVAGEAVASQASMMPDHVDLYAGEARVHRVSGTIRRVAIGNGDVLAVHTVGRNEVVMIGTSAGETNMHLWMADGSQRSITVSVSTGSASQLARTVRELLADERVTVAAIGANVVVSGRDLDQGLVERVDALRKLYPQIVNLGTTDPVAMKPMVRLDVKIMEFNRNALEELGIRWDTAIAGPLGALIKDTTTNPYFRVMPKGDDTFQDLKDTLPTRLPGTQAYFGIATSIASSINLLMSQGKAWILAEPQLSSKSGESAKFLAGGEVPIPVPGPFGQNTIMFKEYGVRLEIQPVVNERGEISTGIMAEVSRIDPSVTVQGVPGLLTRRTESHLNVREGETIVVSGLVDTNAAKSADKFPFLGDIPILGRLFRSDGFRGSRTEMVVFVTPRVVMPGSQENQDGLQRGEEIRRSLEESTSRRQQRMIQRQR
ncbi:type II and III secretion system protein family protein [Luteimonas sp. e5]